MSGKTKPETEGPPQAPAPAKPAFTGISPSARAHLRVECIKAALTIRTVATPISTLVKNACEIEAYVLDPACHLPPPPAPDEESATPEKESETK